jgi:hypothetical protein
MMQTLGEEIIAWIETLRVPEGALVGQPLQLMEWQKREILRIYDNPRRHATGDHQRREKKR